MQMRFRQVNWEFTMPFRIAYRTQTHAETVWVELEEDGRVGRGEGQAVSYLGETPQSMLDQLASVAKHVGVAMTREDVGQLLPPGGARNALDCAMWDLEAKRVGRRAWELAGIEGVRPLITAYTLGVDSPEAMARAAAAVPQYSLLKLKLMDDADIERVTAVREVRPDARLIVDANQSWSLHQLNHFGPRLAQLGIELIEQPFKAGEDEALRGFISPVPLCADESCQTAESLEQLRGKYQYVNIKLDKTGGLSEALCLVQVARELGFDLMVGCMSGSSLAMAPSFIVGQFCTFVDLDGPLLSKHDVPHPIEYLGSRMMPPTRSLWG